MNLPFLGAAALLIASGAIGSPSPPNGNVSPAPGPAAAGTGKPATHDPEPSPPRVRVFVDRRTGRAWEPLDPLVPAPQGLIAFDVVRHPDGTRSVDLQDAFAVNVVVRRNPDGSMSFACVPGLVARGTSARPSRAAASIGGKE